MKWPKSEEFSDFHTQSFGVNMSFQGAAGALRKNGHPLTPFSCHRRRGALVTSDVTLLLRESSPRSFQRYPERPLTSTCSMYQHLLGHHDRSRSRPMRQRRSSRWRSVCATRQLTRRTRREFLPPQTICFSWSWSCECSSRRRCRCAEMPAPSQAERGAQASARVSSSSAGSSAKAHASQVTTTAETLTPVRYFPPGWGRAPHRNR